MISFIFFFQSLLAAPPTVEPSPRQLRNLLEHNRRIRPYRYQPSEAVDRPFAEYEKAQYFLMNHDGAYETEAVKLGMVKALPRPVVAVILVGHASEIPQVRNSYLRVIEASRLRVVEIAGGAGFWARDSLPVPVFLKRHSKHNVALIDAKYYHSNEPDKAIADLFNVPLLQHDYYYEGGNFISDRKGNCMAIEERIRSMSDDFFKSYYGCKKLFRLPKLGGIGHVDERVKFLSDKSILTDEPEYRRTFESAGYSVTLLPKPEERYETYVNSVLINDTLLMPTFDESSDAVAKGTYEGLGLKVFTFSSKSVSNNGHGSLHCISMIYPPTPWARLKKWLGVREF